MTVRSGSSLASLAHSVHGTTGASWSTTKANGTKPPHSVGPIATRSASGRVKWGAGSSTGTARWPAELEEERRRTRKKKKKSKPRIGSSSSVSHRLRRPFPGLMPGRPPSTVVHPIPSSVSAPCAGSSVARTPWCRRSGFAVRQRRSAAGSCKSAVARPCSHPRCDKGIVGQRDPCPTEAELQLDVDHRVLEDCPDKSRSTFPYSDSTLRTRGTVNGNRKLTSCRQVKFDQFGVHSVSVGSVWTRPRSRFFEPVAVAFEGDDVGVVDEPVDHGGGDDFVAEYLAPAAEGLVGGDDETGALVAGGDELEEQVRCLGFEGDVADLVDDEQRVAAEPGRARLATGRWCAPRRADRPIGWQWRTAPDARLGRPGSLTRSPDASCRCRVGRERSRSLCR